MKILLFTILLLGFAIAMIGVRILLVKDGQFRGTCSSSNPLLQKEGVGCSICGAKPNEVCEK